MNTVVNENLYENEVNETMVQTLFKNVDLDGAKLEAVQKKKMIEGRNEKAQDYLSENKRKRIEFIKRKIGNCIIFVTVVLICVLLV